MKKQLAPSESKIVKSFEKSLIIDYQAWKVQLLSGDLLGYEKGLRKWLHELSDKISSALLMEVLSSQELESIAKKEAKRKGLFCLKRREVRIQLISGNWIKVRTWYATKGGEKSAYKSGHVVLDYLGCLKKASPLYCSTVGLIGTICPSYRIGEQLLDQQQIRASCSRIRDLTQSMGSRIRSLGWESLLEKGESLAGKRVVIQIDGGRSRMREYTGCKSLKKREKYNTPWREPNLFTIHVLSNYGRYIEKESLAFYGASMENREKSFAQLEKILKRLKIDQARQVQFIADGAKDYWHHIKRVLIRCRVKKEKTYLTLDYYHAVEHLTVLVNFLKLEGEERKSLWRKWKTLLWYGKIKEIGEEFKGIQERKELEIRGEMERELAYFEIHKDRMQYRKLKYKRLLCGSGLVESAIRRVINLRFKGSSSFWIKKNLENSLPLRCAFLAGRWNIMINSLIAKA